MASLLTEADFHGPYIHQETGLQYENFGSYFIRETYLDTPRNREISIYHGRAYAPHAIRAYWQAYDAAEVVQDNPRGDFGDEHQQRNSVGIAAGRATGCWGSSGSSAA